MQRTACVIDDEPDMVTLAAQILDMEGLATEEFTDAQAFQDHVHQNHVDLAVLDLVMPGMSGHELAAWLRKESPYTRIVLMTGCAGPEMVLEGWELGCDACVVKGKDFTANLREATRRSLDAHELWHRSVHTVRAGYRD